jgi:uncharacterized repeat protein (TIGR03806 family)
MNDSIKIRFFFYAIKKSRYIVFLITFFCFGVQADLNVNDDLILTEGFPDKLSAFRFFEDTRSQLPAKNVIPYDLISSLFSDYTKKNRFVYVPDSLQAKYETDSVYQFPIGSALIKTFYYIKNEQLEMSEQQLLETRLLLRKNDGWHAASYAWDDAQEEARLKIAGATINTSWVDKNGKYRSVRYRVPNKNQCQECHEANKQIIPIGPKARNLNKNKYYADSEAELNQLYYWLDKKVIDFYPDSLDLVVDWQDSTKNLNTRARSYLAINCGHCHSPQGNGASSGLYLGFTEKRPIHIGVMKKPVAAGRGSGNKLYSINPGKPEESILLYRMQSMDPGIMMPESGRSLAHDEGVNLIKEWIQEMR